VVCHVFVDSCLTGAAAVARNTPGTRTSSRGRAMDESNAAPPPCAPSPKKDGESGNGVLVVCHMLSDSCLTGGGANLYRIASPSSSQKAAVVADPLKRSKEDLNAENYGTLVSMCNRFMSRPPVYKRGLVQAILEHQDIEKVERETRISGMSHIFEAAAPPPALSPTRKRTRASPNKAGQSGEVWRGGGMLHDC
jgi:hypothetical protein